MAERRIDRNALCDCSDRMDVGREALRIAKSKSEARRLIEEASRRAEEIITAYWEDIERVAKALLQHKELDGLRSYELITNEKII